jgi:hypothetical protein
MAKKRERERERERVRHTQRLAQKQRDDDDNDNKKVVWFQRPKKRRESATWPRSRGPRERDMPIKGFFIVDKNRDIYRFIF